jgi:hypothetical protein
VAGALGLTGDAVRRLRASELYLDEDFAKVGREIRYSAGAIEKLRRVLKENAPQGVRLGDVAVKVPEAAAGSLSNGAQAMQEASDAAGEVDAVVTKVYPHNQKWMEALLGDLPIVIHVRSNVNFTVGMIIESRRLLVKNERVFDFVGRCPRARGRW